MNPYALRIELPRGQVALIYNLHAPIGTCGHPDNHVQELPLSSCTRRQLHSLAGELLNAATVVARAANSARYSAE